MNGTVKDEPAKIKQIQELKSAREGVAVHRHPSAGQILIAGDDAAPFLHRLSSNEVQKLPVGQGQYNAFLDRKGMTLSLFYLFRLAEKEFLAVTPPQLCEKTLQIMAKMKFVDKVTLKDVSKERGLLTVIGPQAESVVKTLPTGLPCWRDEAFRIPAWGVSGSRPEIDGLASQYPSIGDETIHLLKMEAGFPEYGIDIDETHILLESPVPVAHQRNKGCYPGQEVIERISTYGKGRTPKRLCRLQIEGGASPEKGTEILASDGTKAGHVTSAMYDPLDRQTVVLGYLDNKFAEGAKNLKWENRTLILA